MYQIRIRNNKIYLLRHEVNSVRKIDRLNTMKLKYSVYKKNIKSYLYPFINSHATGINSCIICQKK